jgi:hypothetical protein
VANDRFLLFVVLQLAANAEDHQKPFQGTSSNLGRLFTRCLSAGEFLIDRVKRDHRYESDAGPHQDIDPPAGQNSVIQLLVS